MFTSGNCCFEEFSFFPVRFLGDNVTFLLLDAIWTRLVMLAYPPSLVFIRYSADSLSLICVDVFLYSYTLSCLSFFLFCGPFPSSFSYVFILSTPTWYFVYYDTSVLLSPRSCRAFNFGSFTFNPGYVAIVKLYLAAVLLNDCSRPSM